jgi:hypothetical protein
LQVPDISFGARITQLEEENDKLRRELHGWEHKVTADLERRQFAEEEVRKLYEKCEQMREQVQNYGITAHRFRIAVSKCAQGLDGILPMIEVLKVGVSSGVTTCNALDKEFCPTSSTPDISESSEHSKTSGEL